MNTARLGRHREPRRGGMLLTSSSHRLAFKVIAGIFQNFFSNFFIEVNLTQYRTNYLKVNNSETFGAFMTSFNHLCYPIPNRCHPPGREPQDSCCSPPAPVPPTLHICVCLSARTYLL